MSLAILRGQDILVLAKLVVCRGKRPSIVQLGLALGLGPSHVHGSLTRLDKVHLITAAPTTTVINTDAVIECLVHALKYAFPATRGAPTAGLATGFAAPPLKGLARAVDLPTVWPHAHGTAHGAAVTPIHRTAPEAARRDEALYELLALIDALREHRPGERRLAEQELTRRVRRVNAARSPNDARAARTSSRGRPRSSRIDDETVAIVHQHLAEIRELRFAAAVFFARRLSGSVVDWCVSFERRSPWKLTVGLPGSSSTVRGSCCPSREALLPSPRLEQGAVDGRRSSPCGDAASCPRGTSSCSRGPSRSAAPCRWRR